MTEDPGTAAPSLEDLPLAQWADIGKGDLELTAKLGMQSMTDLLLYLPTDWQDRTRITSIAQLRPGVQAQVEGQVVGIFQPRGRRMLSVQIADDTGRLELLFFHFYPDQVQRLKNARVRCFGEVKRGSKFLRIIHPNYKILSNYRPAPALAKTLTPLYPATGGTQGQKQLEKLIVRCLRLAKRPSALADPVTPLLEAGLAEISLFDALKILHQTPPDSPDLEKLRDNARARLALDELVADMLGQLKAGEQIRRLPAMPMAGDSALIDRLLGALPFPLTQAQLKVNAEIAADMEKSTPMLRLLQGDVGSGKTLVAVCAALKAVGAGQQVALMAPTEVLVEQHLFNLRNWLEPLGLNTAALTASTSAGEKRSILEALKNGQLQLVTGTHALFESDVKFQTLGLVIVDEQHRFGVHQRLRLVDRGMQAHFPHQLTMTATPIPRTLAMTRYAEMDVSVLDEMPPGRHPVQTTSHPEKDRQRIIKRIGERCAGGDRVYWVCALVEESEQLEARAATLVAEELAAECPEVSVGLIHGRMKSPEKLQAIQDFKSGRTDLLVATTVIEVGMDIPEATLIIIENAERFGLAQLHQLRGRVGRSERPSYCALMHGGRLTDTARKRLDILCRHQDGFSIAEADLELRGPGELLGVRQAGEAYYRLFDYSRHQALLAPAKRIAARLLKGDPESTRRLQQRWLAHRLDYARV